MLFEDNKTKLITERFFNHNFQAFVFRQLQWQYVWDEKISYIYFFCYLWNWLSDIKKYAKLYDVSDVIWKEKRDILPENIFPAAAIFIYFSYYFFCVWWQNDETKKYWGNSRNSIMNLTTTKSHSITIFGSIHHLRNFLLMLSLIRNDILYLQHSISIWNQQCRKTLGSSEVYFSFFPFLCC